MFDFQAYVQRRQVVPVLRGVRLQNYAYIGDIEYLRELNDRGFMGQALHLGVSAWEFAEGKRLLKQGRDIGSVVPRAALVWNEVCYALGHAPLPLKVFPTQMSLFSAYGDASEVFFGLSTEGSSLPVSSLKFLFGRGLGALDNGHVPYLTVARFLDTATRGFWEKAAQIPDALLHWRRFAEITEDRAGILACRDISAAIFSIMRMELDWENEEILREIRRFHEHLDVDWGELEVEKRVRAIQFFMESHLYRTTGGETMEAVDARVKDLYHLL